MFGNLNDSRQQTAFKSTSQKEELTYTVTIEGGAEVIFSSFHGVDQVCSVSQVGVRVVAPKVLLGDAVDCRVGRRAQLLTDDLLHIRTDHCREEEWDHHTE